MPKLVWFAAFLSALSFIGCESDAVSASVISDFYVCVSDRSNEFLVECRVSEILSEKVSAKERFICSDAAKDIVMSNRKRVPTGLSGDGLNAWVDVYRREYLALRDGLTELELAFINKDASNDTAGHVLDQWSRRCQVHYSDAERGLRLTTIQERSQ